VPRLETVLAGPRQRLDAAVLRLAGALGLAVSRKRARFEGQAGRHRAEALRNVLARRGDRLTGLERELTNRAERRLERAGSGLDQWASRLVLSFDRVLSDATRGIQKDRTRLAGLTARLETAPARRFGDLSARLEALDRIRSTLGYQETLKRGYAVIWGDGVVVTNKVEAERAAALEVQFQDGKLSLGPRPSRRAKGSGPEQGSLF
jgi:exodeoxyribonuclease VII large subunit